MNSRLLIVTILYLFAAPSSMAAGPFINSPFDPTQPVPWDTNPWDSGDYYPPAPPPYSPPDCYYYPGGCGSEGPFGGSPGVTMCTPPSVPTPEPLPDCVPGLVVGNGYGNYQYEAVHYAKDDARGRCGIGGSLCGAWVSSSCMRSDGSWYAYVLGYCLEEWEPPLIDRPPADWRRYR